MIRVLDILEIKELKNVNLKLVAGKDGLSRPIKKCSVGETMEFADWQQGGEFLVFSGFGMELDKKDNLRKVLNSANQKGISALAFQINSSYISEIPQDIIDLANKLMMPVFTLPWEVCFGTILEPINNLMFDRRMRETAVAELVKYALFSNIDKVYFYENVAENGYNFSEKHRIIMISFEDISNHTLIKIKNSIEQKILLKKALLQEIVLLYNKRIIILAQEDQNMCKNIQKVIIDNFQISNFSIGCGRLYDSVEQWKKSYCEAEISLKAAISSEKQYCDFNNLGFIRLLIDNYDEFELKDYIMDYIGPLLTESESNQVLIDTLKTYLGCNFNLAQTSRVLYIHRNTLLMRLEKIKNLLNKDIDDPMIRREIVNAIYLNDFFKYG